MTLAGLLIFGLLAQQPRPASIEGLVIQAGTAQPVLRAIVELNGERLREPLATVTAADGRFEFRNIASGQYRLTVSRSGYLDGGYGKRGPNGTPAALAVPEGQSLKDIRIALIPSGAISGRVYDGNGEPVAKVPVQALKYSYLDGKRTLTAVTSDETDDRGEYRLYWLPPGQYYVSATPAAGRSMSAFIAIEGAARRTMRIDSHGMVREDGRSGAEKLGEADVPVYYPGTVDAQSAQPVEVRPGADVGRVDFTLMRVKTRRVRGTVLEGITGQPVFAGVVLVPRNPSAGGSLTAGPPADGVFEVKDVLPGSYYVVASHRLNVGGGAFRVLAGRTPIEVGNADVDGVTVVLSPTVDIPGEVIVEGTVPNAPANHHPIVTLKNDFAGGASSTLYASFNDSRRFVINDVVAADYRIQLTDLPQGTYVKSVRFGAADVSNGTMQVDSGTTDRIEIVLSANAGSIEGNVVGQNGAPLANAPLALVPGGGNRQRTDLYRAVWSDEAGRFRFQGIPPGDYSLFAWEDIDEGLWRDPDFVRRNEAAGRPIRVNENSRETIEIRALPFAY
jgi:protocatechuate 3,4-dioxygenase beta subunit